MTASQTTTVQTSEVPAGLKNLYILYYRHGMNPQCYKGFLHNGDLQDAIIRGRKHCEVMNYRFIMVKPMVSDIDMEESYKVKTGRSFEE